MKATILVIEDSKMQARIVEDLLTAIDCDSTVAPTGEVAREKYNSVVYDLILMDMILPDASGLQLLREVRTAGLNTATPVIILSGVSDKGNIIDSITLGANDYLTKPYQPDEFLLKLKMHLSFIRANRELEQTLAAKNKLISIIAHDLRSPFTSLIGFVELMMNNHAAMSNEKRDRYLKLMYGSATGAYELLNNLLMWADVQSKPIALSLPT